MCNKLWQIGALWNTRQKWNILLLRYALVSVINLKEISMFSAISTYAQIKTQRDSIVYFRLGTPFIHFLCASDKSYKVWLNDVIHKEWVRDIVACQHEFTLYTLHNLFYATYFINIWNYKTLWMTKTTKRL